MVQILRIRNELVNTASFAVAQEVRRLTNLVIQKLVEFIMEPNNLKDRLDEISAQSDVIATLAGESRVGPAGHVQSPVAQVIYPL